MSADDIQTDANTNNAGLSLPEQTERDLFEELDARAGEITLYRGPEGNRYATAPGTETVVQLSADAGMIDVSPISSETLPDALTEIAAVDRNPATDGDLANSVVSRTVTRPE